MIINKMSCESTIELLCLIQGEVFTYQGVAYVRGINSSVHKDCNVHCTRLSNGNKCELTGTYQVIHHPTATLTLNP